MNKQMNDVVRALLYFFVAAVALAVTAPPARADGGANRESVADSLDELATDASGLAKTAGASEDRKVRKKFAPHAADISDDLTSLARRARKDVAFETLAKDAAAISKDVAALTELADEADDKGERKALRSQASLLERSVTAARKALEALAAAGDDDAKKPAKHAPMSDESFKRFAELVKAADYDTDRIGLVSQAAQANWFTSEQVADVLGRFDYDDGRVDAGAAMWPHIVDPENSFVIFEKFDYEAGRDALRQRVAK